MGEENEYLRSLPKPPPIKKKSTTSLAVPGRRKKRKHTGFDLVLYNRQRRKAKGLLIKAAHAELERKMIREEIERLAQVQEPANDNMPANEQAA